MLWSETPIEQWPSVRLDRNPNQKEIEFFWPLQEQIPLDLDYTRCQRKLTTESVSIPTIQGSSGVTFAPQTWTTTATFNGDVEVKKLSIVLDKKPNFVVRWMYKLLNINWKI